MDYYTIEVCIHVSVDHERRSVNVKRLWCKSENWWPDIHTSIVPDKSGEGGIGWYKKQLDPFGERMSQELVVDKFFGPGWVAGALPLTRPFATPEAISMCRGLDHRMGDYRSGPWDKVVGTFFTERTDAAKTIQKHYRGWKVRLVTTFNPNTSLGRFLELRHFNNLLSGRTPQASSPAKA
jgi:hypothetical protein